jgi:3-oxoacyl-[acyl-carrier protein] reductase
VTRLFEEVRRAFGRVDVLVNNAGIYALAPIESLSISEFNRHFDTNVLGLLLVTKASLPLFPATGGSIVNIGSVASTFAPPAAAIYVGTKGAVDSMTKSLAKELAPRKIRVNGVNPGFVITEGTHSSIGARLSCAPFREMHVFFRAPCRWSVMTAVSHHARPSK